MKAERFLEELDRACLSYHSISKIRELILSLAVKGKICRQLESEQNSESLLSRILSDREAYRSANGLKHLQGLKPVAAEDAPYSIPQKWRWVRLGNLCRAQAGFAFESSAFTQEKTGVPLIRIRDIRAQQTQLNYTGVYRPEFLINKGDYLVGMDGEFKIAKWQGPQALLNQRVSRLQWYSQENIPSFFCIAAQHQLSKLQGTKAYTTVDHLSTKQIEEAIVPLPPLAEQKRIIAKVDELMALCDRLEAQLKERDIKQAALAKAALAKFTEDPTPENLQLLFHPSFSIEPEELKTCILSLALRGQLCRQSAEDGSAEQDLSDAGVDLKKWKVDESERRHEVPSSWTWIKFGGTGDQRLGKMLDEAKNTGELKPYLRNTSVQWMRFNLDDVKLMRIEKSDQEELRLRRGDLLICEGGQPGRCAIWEDNTEEMYFQKALHRVRPCSAIDSRYLAINLRFDCTRKVIDSLFTGATIKHLTGRALSDYSIPLPPYKEQLRILDRIEILMSLVNTLEAQIETSRTAGEKLLEAMVAELTSA